MIQQLFSWIGKIEDFIYYFVTHIKRHTRIENVAFVHENGEQDSRSEKEKAYQEPTTQCIQIDNSDHKRVYLVEKKETLLEQSLRFKREHPEKYEMRKEERKIRHDKLFGIAPPDPRVDLINSLLSEKLSLKYRNNIRRKNMPPLLTVCFQFVELSRRNKSHHVTLTKLFSEERNNISKFHYKDIKNTKNTSSLTPTAEKAKHIIELRIIVYGASNLHKWSQVEEGKLKTRIICAIHSDSDIYGAEMATPYTKPGYNKITRWGHIFIYRGFTFEQIAERMITFTIETQTSHGKKRLGYINLSARGCILGRVNHLDEDLCTSNSKFWSEFLQNPHDDLEVNLPIFPAANDVGKNTSLLRRFGSTRRSPAKIPMLLPLKNSKSVDDVRRSDKI